MLVTFRKSVLPLEVVGLLGEICVQVDEVLEVRPDLPHVGGHQAHVQRGPLGRPGGEAEGGVGPVVHGEDGGLDQAGMGRAGGGALGAEALHATEGIGGLQARVRGGSSKDQVFLFFLPLCSAQPLSTFFYVLSLVSILN